MRQPSSRPPGWLPYAGTIAIVAGAIFQAGQMSSRIERNSERIAKLEASDQLQTDKLDTINQRGARIEAKIDLALPLARERDR